MPSIKEVARASGVSTATVSRILNNQSGAAGAETRARVLEVVERLNYRPSAIARGLSNQRMNTLGVVMVSVAQHILTPDSYHTLILDGILAANKRQRQKTLLFYEDNWAEAYANLANYCDGQCDGLILLTPIVGPDFFATLHRNEMHFVVTGGVVVGDEITGVAMDERAAGETATRYLLEQGHRRIAHLTGELDRSSAIRRCAGYSDALENAGIAYEECLVLRGAYGDYSGYTRTLTLLDGPRAEWPTALFCADDAIAFGALRALRERGVAVPGEISVLGVNGELHGAFVDPPLTTLRQPFHQIGQGLVELLIAEIEDRATPGTKQKYPGEILVRASVGPPPPEVLPAS